MSSKGWKYFPFTRFLLLYKKLRAFAPLYFPPLRLCSLASFARNKKQVRNLQNVELTPLPYSLFLIPYLIFQKAHIGTKSNPESNIKNPISFSYPPTHTNVQSFP